MFNRLFFKAIYLGFFFFHSYSPMAQEVSSKSKTIIFAGSALVIPGQPPQKNVKITIVGEKIVEILTNQSPENVSKLNQSPDVQFIDLRQYFVLPGLIDVQTHLTSEPGLPSKLTRLTKQTDAETTLRAMANAEKTILSGFTTIRNMGSAGQSMFAVRRAINKGKIIGPRMQVAGEVIVPTGAGLGGYTRPVLEEILKVSAVCDGADDCRRAVRAEAARGATTIKVAATSDLTRNSKVQFSRAELIAIRETAHSLGLKVTASSFSTSSINVPLEVGFDAVVHGTFMDKNSIKLLRKNKAFYIPTLAAANVVRQMATNQNIQVSDEWRAENMAIYIGMVDAFKKSMAAKITMAFGTDAGWRPHGKNGEQLVQMVKLGMPANEVLKTATLNAAIVMGWDDKVGSLKVGYFADIIATKISPLKDMTTVLDPIFVMKGGEIVKGVQAHD